MAVKRTEGARPPEEAEPVGEKGVQWVKQPQKARKEGGPPFDTWVADVDGGRLVCTCINDRYENRASNWPGGPTSAISIVFIPSMR